MGVGRCGAALGEASAWPDCRPCVLIRTTLLRDRRRHLGRRPLPSLPSRLLLSRTEGHRAGTTAPRSLLPGRPGCTPPGHLTPSTDPPHDWPLPIGASGGLWPAPSAGGTVLIGAPGQLQRGPPVWSSGLTSVFVISLLFLDQHMFVFEQKSCARTVGCGVGRGCSAGLGGAVGACRGFSRCPMPSPEGL